MLYVVLYNKLSEVLNLPCICNGSLIRLPTGQSFAYSKNLCKQNVEQLMVPT